MSLDFSAIRTGKGEVERGDMGWYWLAPMLETGPQHCANGVNSPPITSSSPSRPFDSFPPISDPGEGEDGDGGRCRHSSQFKNNHLTEMCCGTEAGSYLRLIDSCITQLKAQGPSRTCNERKEEEEEECCFPVALLRALP